MTCFPKLPLEGELLVNLEHLPWAEVNVHLIWALRSLVSHCSSMRHPSEHRSCWAEMCQKLRCAVWVWRSSHRRRKVHAARWGHRGLHHMMSMTSRAFKYFPQCSDNHTHPYLWYAHTYTEITKGSGIFLMNERSYYIASLFTCNNMLYSSCNSVSF